MVPWKFNKGMGGSKFKKGWSSAICITEQGILLYSCHDFQDGGFTPQRFHIKFLQNNISSLNAPVFYVVCSQVGLVPGPLTTSDMFAFVLKRSNKTMCAYNQCPKRHEGRVPRASKGRYKEDLNGPFVLSASF